MVRECLVGLVLVSASGCSLVLDFSNSAIPIDAQIDAPYSQEQCDYKEPNDSFDTAQIVTAADTGPAAICAGESEDHDFYKFSVPGGTTKVVVKVTLTNRPSGDLDLKFRDGAGALIASSSGFGDQELITCPGMSPQCPTLAPGEYIFEVFPAIAGSVNSYDFQLMLTP
jgi:hypothetical protein